MNTNVVSFAAFQKKDAPAAPAARLTGLAAHRHTRGLQVQALVEKVKAAGEDHLVVALGQRLRLDESSDFGFHVSDRWRDLAHVRAGSDVHNKANGKQVNLVVTAHYPLLGVTVYYNYVKPNDMYYGEMFVYQDGEVVPSFQYSSWFEDFARGVSLANGVCDKVLEGVLGEQKKKYNMSLIDFKSTKDINFREYAKNARIR